METNKLKKFAVDARNKLKAGVAAKMLTLGFDRNGNVPEHLHPQLMQGGSLWNGQLQTESFYHQWNALYKRIKQKGIREVYEEAAYTWFNRLVAIRILQKNGIIEPVLEYVDAARTPRIVDEARMGRIPQMQEAQRIRLLELLDDDARIKDQFAVLIAAYCHQNPILNACFGSVDDYTELLLPNDILTEGGFVDMLNHTEFITDADFRSPELIGWLYQFYISERKEEVFASFKKGNKADAEDIPAATQIFTPNWIVKYMVQNTIGRIYLDNHPLAASEFKHKWKYLVEPSTPTSKEAIYQFNELTELLTGDLACGSGHILNECFDLFYDLYIYEGYSRKEAIENIFKHNLKGVDLDTRAKQLSQFALLLKACQKDLSFAEARILPMVLDMPTPIPLEQLSDSLKDFFQESPTSQIFNELKDAFYMMKDADSLGSIMKFDISESTRLAMSQMMNYWYNQNVIPEQVEKIKPSINLILTLTEKYAALVMNPPYMGNRNMNEILKSYVNEKYNEGKSDLCTTFMIMQGERTHKNGLYANIIPPSWLFLSTFDTLRRHIIDNKKIESLLHLSRGVFGADFGSVSCVIRNSFQKNATGIYFKLIERTFQEFEQSHLRILLEKTIMDHSFRFKFSDYSKDIKSIEAKEDGSKIYFQDIPQNSFDKIPGSPLAYWLNDIVLDAYSKSPSKSYIDFKTGITTGDNPRFTRYWMEVDLKNNEYWKFLRSGGTYRKWYGCLLDVVYWKNDGELIRSMPNSTMRNPEYMYKPCITWSKISSGDVSVRYSPQEVLFDAVGLCGFAKNEILLYAMALYNSRVGNFFIRITNASMSILTSDLGKIPYIENNKEKVLTLVKQNVNIAKDDWDSHETSWDFETNPLLTLRESLIKDDGLQVATVYNEEDVRFDVDNERETAIKMQFANNLETLVKMFKRDWEERFIQLHYNEEELNRQFIDTYGLQDELRPNVPFDEITILQQGEISISDNKLTWNDDVLMKQLISYAVGVWMGRYKLGKKGLHIAHPEPTDRELQEYWYGGEQVFIDDDAIIPILPQNSPFDDNLSSRIADFIRIVLGAENLTENLNCIEKMLGMTIDQYVQRDFWKDHKKMYQNRPIYWLFSSKKGAFKCLAYMHRMDPYTAERIRSNYLLPYIEYLQNQIGDLESRAAALTTAENRKLTNLHKALDECQEYHERLQVVAEQAIGFDLDDGVLVNYAKFGDVLAKIK